MIDPSARAVEESPEPIIPPRRPLVRQVFLAVVPCFRQFLPRLDRAATPVAPRDRSLPTVRRSAVLVDYAATIFPRQQTDKKRGSGRDSADRAAGLQRRDYVKRIRYVPIPF